MVSKENKKVKITKKKDEDDAQDGKREEKIKLKCRRKMKARRTTTKANVIKREDEEQ